MPRSRQLLLGLLGIVLGTATGLLAHYGFGLSGAGSKCLGIAVLLVTYWVTEPLPIGVTSLLPIILLPLFGVVPGSEVSAPYFSDAMLIFFGSFLLAVAVEEHNLHRRLALLLLRKLGGGRSRLTGGFVAVSALLSTALSNTSTAAIMTPIARAVLATLDSGGGASNAPGGGGGDVNAAVYLGVAFGSTLGGTATLTGTGPNIILQGTMTHLFGVAPTYLEWFLATAGLSATGVLACWAILAAYAAGPPAGLGLGLEWLGLGLGLGQGSRSSVRYKMVAEDGLELLTQASDEGTESPLWADADPKQDAVSESAPSAAPVGGEQLVRVRPGDDDAELAASSGDDGDGGGGGERVADLDRQYAALGPMSHAEKTIAVVFALTALLWMLRRPNFSFFAGWGAAFPDVTDGTVALAAALSLMLLPQAPGDAAPILQWRAVNEVDWEVLFLLGGGFCLSLGFQRSGLSERIAEQLASATDGFAAALVLCCVTACALSNVVSNVATASILLPSIACVAPKQGLHPIALMGPVAVSCSFSFLLPIGTPPNALAVSTGHVTKRQMAAVGGALSVLCLALLFTLYAMGTLGLVMPLDHVPPSVAEVCKLKPDGDGARNQ